MGILDKLKRAVGIKPKEYVDVRDVERERVEVRPQVPRKMVKRDLPGYSEGVVSEVKYAKYPEQNAPRVQAVYGKYPKSRSNQRQYFSPQKTEQILREQYQASKRAQFIRSLNKRITGVESINRAGVPTYTKPKLKAYGGAMKQTPVRMLRMQSLAGAFGTRIPYQGIYYQGKTGKIGRGRPRGPSGRYYIPGKGPVGVYQYRRWLQNVKKLRQLRGQEAYPQQYQRMPMQRNMPPQMPQQIPQNVPLQVQQQQIRAREYQNQYPQETQQPIGSFNALQVPNPFKQSSPQVTPINPFKQLSIFNVQQPVTNPTGDYYTESDWMTGQQVLRRRSQDRLFQW